MDHPGLDSVQPRQFPIQNPQSRPRVDLPDRHMFMETGEGFASGICVQLRRYSRKRNCRVVSA
jgi:hypothetical protein